jgi:hypothetical protein
MFRLTHRLCIVGRADRLDCRIRKVLEWNSDWLIDWLIDCVLPATKWSVWNVATRSSIRTYRFWTANKTSASTDVRPLEPSLRNAALGRYNLSSRHGSVHTVSVHTVSVHTGSVRTASVHTASVHTARFQHLAILRSARTVYLCVLCGSQNKQRLFLYTTLTDWFL